MSLFTGAPIVNNGYYDIPINNQYSNQNMYNNHPIKTNQYKINKNINNTINNNNDSYIVYQEPNVPSNSLYIESDTEMSNYYNEPKLSLLDNNNMPLIKKKEMISNGSNVNYIEEFNGANRFLDPVVYGRGGNIGPSSGYMLGPGRNINNSCNQDPYVKLEQNNNQYETYFKQTEINNSDNYWNDNDPGYTNYYFVPEYKVFPQQQVLPVQHIVSQQRIPVQQIVHHQRILPVQQIITQQKITEQKIIPNQKYIKKIEKNKPKISKESNNKYLKNNKIKLLKDDIKIIKSNLKENKKNKNKDLNIKNNIDKNTLWTIIIIMTIIIVLFTLKTLYDYKVIRFISK
jgi:hypothetical protein